jgi:aspartate-semialdehyde dehydrogenase
MHENVPLIVPEVNASVLDEFFEDDKRSNIIANPNCSTIQMIMALKPLHDASIINRVVVSTYQSVSGAGKEAMDELFNQTQNIYSNKALEKNKFTKQIAFNAIPHIDSFIENGNTKEEEKMINETKKILDKGINISATCVRIPVFISHAESINIEFDSPLDEKEATKLLKNFDGISVIDYQKDEGYITPIEAAGEDKVYVSRIRKDTSIDNGLNIWVVADNLRKGAALNAVQIAEILITQYKQYL